MERAREDQSGQDVEVRLDQQDQTATAQHTRRLVEEGDRVSKVVERVHAHDGARDRVSERQLLRVGDDVDDRGEVDVRVNHRVTGQRRQARPDFDDQPSWRVTHAVVGLPKRGVAAFQLAPQTHLACEHGVLVPQDVARRRSRTVGFSGSGFAKDTEECVEHYKA